MKTQNVRTWAFPLIVLLVAGALWVAEQRPQQTQVQIPERKIALIPVWEAKTSVFFAVPDGWDGEVFGPDREDGVMAVYHRGAYSIALLIKDAGDWQVSDAVSAHLAGLRGKPDCTWCDEPEALRLGSHEGQVFTYADNAVVFNHARKSEQQAPILHSVGTWVINNKIFRVQASTVKDAALEVSGEVPQERIEELLWLIQRVRFAPIDSLEPVEELSKL